LVREAAEQHATATAESQRMVTEAEGRANAAEDRSREAINAANSYRDQTQTDAEALLAKARREADQLVNAAKKQAEALRVNGHAESEQALAAIKSEVDRVSKRRDAIVAQLGALKDVVSGFGKDEEDAPAPGEASEPTE
jgi:F0F1-type ATP synthase membrane subunit b/b'